VYNIKLRRLHFSLDVSTGKVYKGKLGTQDPSLSGNFGVLMKWADKFRKLNVRTNADTPHDAEVARKFGAEGIGLCRTEHMFFEGERIKAVREMILASDLDQERKHSAKIYLIKKEFCRIIQSNDRIGSYYQTSEPL
jgi:pyruvate,orthophosphate dikinase